MTLFPAPRILYAASSALLALQQSSEPVLEQLPPAKRAAVVMALLGIVIVGLFLIVLAMLGGHWARRLARHRPGKKEQRVSGPGSESTVTKNTLPPIASDERTDETIRLGRSPKDTRVDG